MYQGMASSVIVVVNAKLQLGSKATAAPAIQARTAAKVILIVRNGSEDDYYDCGTPYGIEIQSGGR